MILYIDTTQSGEVIVILKKMGKIVKKIKSKNEFGSQVLLPLIEKVLRNERLKAQDLTAVEVNTGPGSYTGIKVGVAVANALGFSLNILVNGKKIEDEINYQ